MTSRRALLGLFAAACVPTTADPPSASPNPSRMDSGAVAAIADAAPVVEARADAGAVEIIKEGSARWRSVPTEQNGFYAVLDGICSELGATRVGKDFVLHYGGASPMYASNRQGPASLAGLRGDRLESIGHPEISQPTGVAGDSLDEFWIADSTGTRTSEGAVLHRYSKGTWKKYPKDQTNLHRWLEGSILGTLSMFAHNGELWVEGTTTKPPPALEAGLVGFKRIAAFPTGDVMLIARPDQNGSTGPLLARHWAPGKSVTTHRLDKLLPGEDWPDVLETAPDEVYLAAGPNIVRWDGSAFRLVGKTKDAKPVSAMYRAGKDDLWVETRVDSEKSESPAFGLQRVSSAGATTIATPETLLSIAGVELGAPWAVGVSGKVYKRDGETWKPMPLPKAPFSGSGVTPKAKQVVAAGPDDVLVIAKYWEKGPAWKEQELHTMMLRTKPMKETLRCNEPDPENNNVNIGQGFQSWPPLATAACTTPFVVLARRSNAVRKVDDWPRLQAAFKGRAELGDVSLVEFTSGDRTFVGAKAPSVETAKKMAELAAKADRLRPEVVCGDPEPLRTIPVAK